MDADHLLSCPHNYRRIFALRRVLDRIPVFVGKSLRDDLGLFCSIFFSGNQVNGVKRVSGRGRSYLWKRHIRPFSGSGMPFPFAEGIYAPKVPTEQKKSSGSSRPKLFLYGNPRQSELISQKMLVKTVAMLTTSFSWCTDGVPSASSQLRQRPYRDMFLIT